MTAAWVQTYTGRAFNILDPSPDSINIMDIAVSLSRTQRFNGHTKNGADVMGFYSVAEHSYLGSTLAKNKKLAQWMLLHDAAEAYIGDIVTPVKALLPEVYSIEARIMEAVKLRFGLPDIDYEEVKSLDAEMLAAEALAFMTPFAQPWGKLAKPAKVTFLCYPPHLMFNVFLREFYFLFEGR